MTQGFADAMMPFAAGVTTAGANALALTTVVVAGGLAAARVAGRRGAAARSAVLRGTLAAAAVGPILAVGLGAAGVHGLGFKITPPADRSAFANTTAVGIPIVTTPSAHGGPVARAPSAAAEPSTERRTAEATGGPMAQDAAPLSGRPARRPVAAAGEPLPSAAATSAAVQSPAIEAVPPSDRSPAKFGAIGWAYVGLAVAWAAGAMGLAVRLAVAHGLLAAARRRARPAPADVAADCAAAARALGVPAPPVLVTPFVRTPCLVGWRPAVLVPAGEGPAVGPAALAHELAHLRRGDCMWHLAARLACAAFWFQPLLWALSRRLERAADEACDDHVLTAGHDRRAYAAELVDWAEQLQRDGDWRDADDARPLWPARLAGVGIVPFRSAVGRRVARLLDAARPLAPTAGRRTVAVAAVLAVGGAAAAGLLGAAAPPANEPAAGSTPADARGGESASATRPAVVAVVDAASPSSKAEGIVVDEAGAPVAGARVRIAAGPTVAETVSGDDGRFAADMTLPPNRRGLYEVWARTPDGAKLAAGGGRVSAPPFDDPTAPPEPAKPAKLVLKPARSFPVTVADAAGNPVAGARVAAYANFALVGETTTDADGRAKLRAAADKPLQYVLVNKAGAGLDYVLFWREKEPRTDPYRLPPDHAGPLAFLLNGARPIAVTVTDERQKPLVGVNINPWYYEKPKHGSYVNLPSESFLHTTTGADGVARFEMPADVSNIVNVWARLDGFDAPDRCMYDPKKDAKDKPSADVATMLVRRVPLAGRVLGPDGKPAAGATVLVGGDGRQFDAFTGKAKTGADGRFSLDISPDRYYLIVARQDRLASAPLAQVIRSGRPPAAIELTLAPATRVVGRMTGGPDHAPLSKGDVSIYQRTADNSYLKLPPEEMLPGTGQNGMKSISPHVYQQFKADEKGAFEAFVGPGAYTVQAYASGASAYAQFKVSPGQPEVAVEAYAKEVREQPRTLAGRVVRKGDAAGAGVADLTLTGEATGGDISFINGTSGPDGAFTVRRGSGDLYLHAVSADRKTQGIAVVKAADPATGAVVEVGPTGSAAGRLVDPAGAPLAGRQIDYGVRVTHENTTFGDRFGGKTTTGPDGRFELVGLVPGYPYQLNLVVDVLDDGSPRGWRTVGQAKADKPERVLLGDLAYTAPPPPKTWQQYAAEDFHPKTPLEERVAKAQQAGRFCYQRTMIVFAAPDRPTAQLLGKIRYDFRDQSDGHEAAGRVMADFVTVSIDVTAADGATGEKAKGEAAKDGAADARKLAEKYGVAWPVAETALVVLDEAGRPIAATVGADLAGPDGKPDVKRLLAWARGQAGPKPDAQKLLDDALAVAKRDDKRVLVDESSAYCGWCVKLGQYLEAQKDLLAKDYVLVTLDRRLPNGPAVMGRLRPKQDGGTPWMVILDADGRRLVDSDAAGGNIGYPTEPADLAHWSKMLKSTARRLTDADVERLLKPLTPVTPTAPPKP